MSKALEWVIDNKYKKVLGAEDAKFILEQAEKRFKETTDSNNLILSRTTSLITLTTGTFIVLIGIVVNKLETGAIDAVSLASFLSCFYLFYIILLLRDNFKSTNYLVLGELPKNSFTAAFYPIEETKEGERLLWYYIDAIEQYQERITSNDKTNITRWALFNKALNLIIYTPLILSGLYIIMKIIFSFYGK